MFEVTIFKQLVVNIRNWTILLFFMEGGYKSNHFNCFICYPSYCLEDNFYNVFLRILCLLSTQQFYYYVTVGKI